MCCVATSPICTILLPDKLQKNCYPLLGGGCARTVCDCEMPLDNHRVPSLATWAVLRRCCPGASFCAHSGLCLVFAPCSGCPRTVPYCTVLLYLIPRLVPPATDFKNLLYEYTPSHEQTVLCPPTLRYTCSEHPDKSPKRPSKAPASRDAALGGHQVPSNFLFCPNVCQYCSHHRSYALFWIVLIHLTEIAYLSKYEYSTVPVVKGYSTVP